MQPNRAIYPGTFDPITFGHIDLVERASGLFETVVVGVAINPGKCPVFSLEERVKMASEALAHLPNIEVRGFDGLLIDVALAQNTAVIVRGLRAVSDFEYEIQLAAMNRRMQPKVETVFLTPSEQFTYISSSLVREIAKLGGDVHEFVPKNVEIALQNKLQNER